ncbi:MAG: CRISPR-associated protein Csm2 [Eubacteriales bacterium]|nr:CRISPR-associated protein Csm2 [Eubacteriales bacterium]MDN5364324.1 CRISPR-associated protein Csm2 [Eubacteriales bacterium]
MNGQGHQSKKGQAGRDDELRELKAKVKVVIDPNQDPDGAELIAVARKMAEVCARKNMTTSQIRHLFQEVQQIRGGEGFLYQVNKLRYKFAYTAGRHREVKPLQQVAEVALSEVRDEKNLARFRDFFEAVVAYHRYLGGRE